jgi:hypothetical protein
VRSRVLLLLAAPLAACGEDARLTQPSPPAAVTVTGGTIGRPLSGAWIAAVPLTLTAQGFAASDGSALTYTWSFGDGTTGTGASVVHAFAAGVYTVGVTATTAAGQSATALLTGLAVQSVSGRWSLETAAGRVMVNTALTQDGLDLHGDDTRLNCRFTVAGVLSPPRTVALSYIRGLDDCAAHTVPLLVVFAGTADDRIDVFTGVTNTGEPALLARCRGPGCD